jgi:hypothetical protein
VPFCERSARTGFQVSLEANGVSFIAEFHRHHDGPGPVQEGVTRGTIVVPVQAAGDVVCDSDVVSRRVGIAPQDVDDSLLDSVHGAHRRTVRASVNRRYSVGMAWKDAARAISIEVGDRKNRNVESQPA